MVPEILRDGTGEDVGRCGADRSCDPRVGLSIQPAALRRATWIQEFEFAPMPRKFFIPNVNRVLDFAGTEE
jgi:hypothetical protein